MSVSSCRPSHIDPCALASYSDASAIEAVFDRCSASLYRFFVVRTGGDTHVSSDLMQQLWLHASVRGAAVPAAEVEFWLRGIARNLVRAHWRAAGRRASQLSLADPRLAAELGSRLATEIIPADILECREVREQLLMALTELDHDEQSILIWHYFDGKSHAGLADLLGISERAAEGRLYRARRSLRSKLMNLQ